MAGAFSSTQSRGNDYPDWMIIAFVHLTLGVIAVFQIYITCFMALAIISVKPMKRSRPSGGRQQRPTKRRLSW